MSCDSVASDTVSSATAAGGPTAPESVDASAPGSAGEAVGSVSSLIAVSLERRRLPHSGITKTPVGCIGSAPAPRGRVRNHHVATRWRRAVHRFPHRAQGPAVAGSAPGERPRSGRPLERDPAMRPHRRITAFPSLSLAGGDSGAGQGLDDRGELVHVLPIDRDEADAPAVPPSADVVGQLIDRPDEGVG